MIRLIAISIVVALVGCATEPSRPAPRGTQVTGKALAEIITGAVIHGQYYKTNNRYIERHHIGGSYVLISTKTPDAESYDNKETGTWQIKGDQVCYEVPSKNASGCILIYELNGQIEFVHPVTRRTWSISHNIEYEREAPPAIAGTPPPVTVAVPAPPQAPRKRKLLSTGSGFIVNNQTFVLTNEHVIEECTEVTVKIDHRDINAIVAARDSRNDLALLQLPAGKYPTVAFRGNDGLYPGDSVVAIGYPLSRLLASEGNVSIGIVSALAGPGNDASLLQVSTPVQPGNSGGPLFDSSGNVVGVIVAGLGKTFFETNGTLAQNVNFAIKSAIPQSFMQASGVKYQTRKSENEMRPADIARKGRPATVYIKCWG
ncbi:MAG: serine protease [Alphaproteobacteria bacterium]|nr:serine protease [Alphaproteobacteria bacterium]